MKTFENQIYTMTPCTAISLHDLGNESARQEAILLQNTADSGEKFQMVIFGWDIMDISVDNFPEACENGETDWEVLETVKEVKA